MELTLQQPTKCLLLYFINNLPLFDILKGSICPFQRRKLSQWFRYYRLFNLCRGPFSDNDRAFLFNTWKLCTVVCCCSVYKYASRYITLSLYIQSWDSIKRAVAAFELFNSQIVVGVGITELYLHHRRNCVHFYLLSNIVAVKPETRTNVKSKWRKSKYEKKRERNETKRIPIRTRSACHSDGGRQVRITLRYCLFSGGTTYFPSNKIPGTHVTSTAGCCCYILERTSWTSISPGDESSTAYNAATRRWACAYYISLWQQPISFLNDVGGWRQQRVENEAECDRRRFTWEIRLLSSNSRRLLKAFIRSHLYGRACNLFSAGYSILWAKLHAAAAGWPMTTTATTNGQEDEKQLVAKPSAPAADGCPHLSIIHADGQTRTKRRFMGRGAAAAHALTAHR